MRELLNSMGRTFLVVTTGALFSMAVIASVFSSGNPSELFITVAELWRILFIALFSALTSLIMYSPRELAPRQMLIRKLAQFVVVFAGIIFFALKWKWIAPNENMLQSVSFVGTVIAVYAVVMLLEYIRDKRMAEELNLKLSEYRQKDR